MKRPSPSTLGFRSRVSGAHLSTMVEVGMVEVGMVEGAERWFPRNIDVRRAVLAVLMRERGAISIAELRRRLELDERLVLEQAWTTATVAKRLSGVLTWQLQRGRVERVRRGFYRFVPGSVTPSMAWRCRNWRRMAEQRKHR